MSTTEKPKSKIAEEERKSEIAEEMESEMDDREEARLEGERAEQEDLKSGHANRNT